MLGPSLRMQKKLEYPPGVLTSTNPCTCINKAIHIFLKHRFGNFITLVPTTLFYNS